VNYKHFFQIVSLTVFDKLRSSNSLSILYTNAQLCLPLYIFHHFVSLAVKGGFHFLLTLHLTFYLPFGTINQTNSLSPSLCLCGKMGQQMKARC